VVRRSLAGSSTGRSRSADKEALFVAAFDRDAARLGDDALNRSGPMDAAYRQQVVSRFVTRLDSYPLVYRVLAGHEPGLLVRLVDGVVPHRIRQVLEASLRAGQQSGDIAADLDPRDTAIALGAHLHRGHHHRGASRRQRFLRAHRRRRALGAHRAHGEASDMRVLRPPT
jgi:AcrR family transcriptional regulator